jgi:stage II sporulation protein M
MHDENVREIFRTYIAELKPYLAMSLIIFSFSFVLGYIAYVFYPEYATTFLSMLEDTVAKLEGMNSFQIMLFIFTRNASVMLASIIIGSIFGLVPLIILLENGIVIGFFTHLQASENGFLYIAAGLIPHGIIEIPMFLTSAAIGFKLGHQSIRYFAGKEVHLKAELVRSLKFYFHWILPLVFLAAVIETFVTPVVIYMVSGV